MNFEMSSRIESEIKELIKKGWVDFPSKSENLHIALRMGEEEISFPHDFYNPDIGNQDSLGIWAKWRAMRIISLMKELNLNLLWEVGSGNGNVAIPLQRENIATIGIEPLLNGALITAKSGVRTYLGTLESLHLPPNSISAIGAFDVLEHLEKPENLLREIFRVLKPGGLLLVTVPAHPWLFSNYDDSIGHFRRYSKQSLFDLMRQSGFLSTKIESMFSILVLPALLLRRLPYLFAKRSKSKRNIVSSTRQLKIANALGPVIVPFLQIERKFRFPFGLSLFCVSKK